MKLRPIEAHFFILQQAVLVSILWKWNCSKQNKTNKFIFESIILQSAFLSNILHNDIQKLSPSMLKYGGETILAYIKSQAVYNIN